MGNALYHLRLSDLEVLLVVGQLDEAAPSSRYLLPLHGGHLVQTVFCVEVVFHNLLLVLGVRLAVHTALSARSDVSQLVE